MQGSTIPRRAGEALRFGWRVVPDRRCKLSPRESQDKISEDAQIAISTVTIADDHGEREASNDDTRRTRWYGQAP
ncbi:hypothetical protein PSO31014_02894 [Pandoraea soli]|uniref:Uncharacterized protein n=1 Tax=Pandoraea soli TaxID=2508293 RepID=A0ABY6W1X8_9BURK|nr:hypothetical protein PSO31014_02894 [Pandoraea soli]